MRVIEITNHKVGRWTVISRADNTPNGQSQWLCRCTCGNEKVLKSIVIRRGLSQSCGCFKRETMLARFTKHGHATNGISPTYHSWASMIARCTNPNNKAFPDYGGRGISVCERWKTFQNFLEDMGEKPTGLSLDRINNDGNYEPGNCRWASDRTQARNRRSNRFLTFNGKTQSIRDWAQEMKLGYQNLTSRLHYGWSVERALTEPLRKW